MKVEKRKTILYIFKNNECLPLPFGKATLMNFQNKELWDGPPFGKAYLMNFQNKELRDGPQI